MKSSKIIFSGIQPTGGLHLGNYLGAIKYWRQLQDSHTNYNKIFCIVDYHALTNKFTVDHNILFKKDLMDSTLELTAGLLACGIDPKKSTLFLQSHVPAHTEFMWLLSCIAPMNWLNRMTQFKDKKTKNATLGLFSYPVLMASDIMLYKANIVPVGEDQIQHIELARDYAERFNQLFISEENKQYEIPMPKALISNAPKVMSLTDGLKKMSKSDHKKSSCQFFNDSPEQMMEKVMKAKTDSIGHVTLNENRIELTNQLKIYSWLEDQSLETTAKKFENQQLKEFKAELAVSVSKEMSYISEKMDDYLSDTEYLFEVLREGGVKANAIAEENIYNYKRLMGQIV